MDRVKLIKEPECWVGPNSILADPEGFPDIPEDYFAPSDKEAKDLQELIDEKCKTDYLGYTAKNNFLLQGSSKSFNDKQQKLSEALDKQLHNIHSDQDKLKADVQDLWKLNNVDYG